MQHDETKVPGHMILELAIALVLVGIVGVDGPCAGSVVLYGGSCMWVGVILVQSSKRPHR